MTKLSPGKGQEYFFARPADLEQAEFLPLTPQDKERSILYMGCPEFSLPLLQSLVDQGFNLLGVATQPDRPVGRKQLLTPTPTKVLAEELGLPVFTWPKLDQAHLGDDLAKLKPDLIITSAYGNILPAAVLNIPRFGCLNVHPSLLPRWRGASPVASAIMAGDQETALSIIEMGEGLDDGDLVASCRLPILAEDDTPSLSQRLADLAAQLLPRILPAWYRGLIETRVQDDSQSSYAKKLDREDGLLDFRLTAQENLNKIRALTPWPGTYTYYQGKRYKVFKASLADQCSLQPGQVVRQGRDLLVACRDACLRLETLQGPNGKLVSACECYHNFAEGTCFGGPES
ncbi:MAG: methionyl-tRNA formyltransferase [Eubacteriales bacterium]|nr:methionyl-tRNA formyltransferase [Eubacteriales bacterium]